MEFKYFKSPKGVVQKLPTYDNAVPSIREPDTEKGEGVAWEEISAEEVEKVIAAQEAKNQTRIDAARKEFEKTNNREFSNN